MGMIYGEFEKWPFAVLAARDPEHFHNARRRKTGGDWTNAEFDEPQLDRALLTYAEQHAGFLPGKNEYERWQMWRPDLPSPGQVLQKRNGKGATRTWESAQRSAVARALIEGGWPITSARINLSAWGTQ